MPFDAAYPAKARTQGGEKAPLAKNVLKGGDLKYKPPYQQAGMKPPPERRGTKGEQKITAIFE